MTDAQAKKEKNWAALSSVLAAIFLTGFKLVVGLGTGSLGILAEAAHSGLDLVAALFTFVSIRISARPADKDHLYGHGKVENLSALFETLLLLITCVWVIVEAVERLFFKTVFVDASAWAFAIMFLSIGIDYSRSRLLYRVAKKHNSQALEADALHFSSDIWSSCGVIIGLVCVKLSEHYPVLLLKKADALSAVFVVAIILVVSMKLLTRTVRVLIDSAPPGMEEKVKEAAEKIPGVSNCHSIRMRYSGSQLFVDVHILVDGNQSLAEAHRLTEKVEAAIQILVPDADVTVHPEPKG